MLPPPAIRGVYRTDDRARAAYAEGAGIYRILPQAVCLPADTDDLATVIRWAGDQAVSLVPRGAGSAMGGGNVGDGVLVDLGALRPRQLEVDAVERRGRTSAGVTLAELNGAAAEYSLRLPPDPSSGRWASLGGMVATNAAGARSLRYGSVRRWVEALTLVTADGEIVTLRRRGRHTGRAGAAALERFERDASPAIEAAHGLITSRFPRTRKNSSGYALDAYLSSGDVLDLIIGSEGTLGVVTEIEWRLDKLPACRAGLRLTLESLDQIAPVVMKLNRLNPSAVELLDRSFLDLVGVPGGEAVLLIELEGEDDDSLRRAVEEATADVRSMVASVDPAFSPEAAERLWAIRHAASPILAALPESRRSLQVIEDACVPVERMGDYIGAVRRVAADRGIPVVMFGHAGDGHVHVNLLPDVTRPGWEHSVIGLMDEVTEAVIRLGGTASGEHGDGRLRAQVLDRVYGSEIVGLFRLVKQSFDPRGTFNPGIILPTGESPIDRLKVGSAAAAIPADIERSLREIERSGGYGRRRLELV